jgi:HAD superfamily hydrolase (TIGR01549 family)
MLEIGFILDMDGTLVDSTGIIRRIQAEIVNKFNIKFSPERERELESYAESMFQENYSTRLAIKIMWSLMKEAGMKFFDRIKAFIMAAKLYLKEIKELKLYDGVEELIQFFEENSLSYVIVTNSSDKSVSRYLKNYPEFYTKMKPKIISKDSVTRVKPDPESFELALKILKVPRDKVVIVGDTKYDILFGKANNALTIGVLTGIYSEELLLEYKPDFIFDSVADIPNKIEEILDKIKH